MSAGHTKGPWAFVIEDRERKIIAPPLVEGAALRTTLMCDTTYYPWCPDNSADWLLISAAPELLEALIDVVGWVPGRQGWHTDAPVKAVERARDAIARATGASNV